MGFHLRISVDPLHPCLAFLCVFATERHFFFWRERTGHSVETESLASHVPFLHLEGSSALLEKITKFFENSNE